MKNQISDDAVSIFQGEVFEKVYKQYNYQISVKNANRKCIIYFSGSGIYFPNSLREFEKAFIEQDKYEWYSYDEIQSVGKYIWVRDIAKQFYILGISEKINSLGELIKLLERETRDYDVICVGSSAGGYAATVVGEYLQAEYILSFSGFFSLDIVDTKIWPLVEEYRNDNERNQYYNLRQCIIKYKVPIFYFYPSQLEGDVAQYEVINDINECYAFGVDCHIHGIPFYHFCLNKLIEMNKEELISLHRSIEGKRLTKMKMTILIMGKAQTYVNLIRLFLKKCKNLLHNKI